MKNNCGILANTPIILMNKDTNLLEIYTVEKLHDMEEPDNFLIWSIKKYKNTFIPCWSKIKKVNKIKSDLRPFHLANSKNWLLATEDTKLLMKTNCIISIQNIRKNTPLLSIGYPYSDILPIQNGENCAAEPGEHISFSDIIGNRYCDICEIMIASKRKSFTHYYHCDECEDYDLCNKCFKDGYLNPPHKKTHKMTKHFGYNLGDYINAKNCSDAQKGLLNFRDPIRYYSIPVKNFVDTQAKMLLADKTGYNACIDMGNTLSFITLDTSFEAMEEEYDLTTNGQALSNRKYEMIVRDRYIMEYRSVPFLHLRSDRYNGRRHLLPHGNDVYVGNFMRQSYLIGEHYTFNNKLEYVYQIDTESGYFHAGIGGLVVCCF